MRFTLSVQIVNSAFHIFYIFANFLFVILSSVVNFFTDGVFVIFFNNCIIFVYILKLLDVYELWIIEL